MGIVNGVQIVLLTTIDTDIAPKILMLVARAADRAILISTNLDHVLQTEIEFVHLVESVLQISTNQESVLERKIGFAHGVHLVIGISTKQDHVPDL